MSDAKKTVEAFHIGPKGIKELDPAMQGNGADRRKFMRTGVPQTNVSHAYLGNSTPEEIVMAASGGHKHKVIVDLSKMYDITKDEAGYLVKAMKDMVDGKYEGNPVDAQDLARTRIKEAGYHGLHRRAGASEHGSVELFHKTPIVGEDGYAKGGPVRGPSKHTSHHRLAIIKSNNYQGEGGQEYDQQETDDAIIERKIAEAERMVKAANRHESEDPEKFAQGGNAGDQRKKIFGTNAAPAKGSDMQEKHMEHIKRFAKQFLGLELKPSGGKIDAKTGQRRSDDAEEGVDRPDWRSGQLESQSNPDAMIHELAHLMLLPKGIGLKEGQTHTDKQYSDVQKQYGYMKQKQSQGEVQPMAAEQLIRRFLGLPANKNSVPVADPESPLRASVEDPSTVIGTRVKKGNKWVDLIRQSRNLTPDNRKRIEDVLSGQVKFHHEHGWVPNEDAMGAKIKQHKADNKVMADKGMDSVRQVADEYAQEKGIKLQHGSSEAPIDHARAKQIAVAYEAMEHKPNDPKVKEAYNALIDETMDQFQHIKKSGLKISKIEPGQENPYKSSKDVFHDIAKNNHLWFFPTESGYGADSEAPKEHPLMIPTSEKIGNHRMLANDVFRVVHDYFGHAKEGNGFGPTGEESAWKHHKQMYSPEAQKALTSETRGQNSWVNFGPHGEHNRKNPAQTKYADQKAGLLPDWAVRDDQAPKKIKMAEGGDVAAPAPQAVEQVSSLPPGAIPYDGGQQASAQPIEKVDQLPPGAIPVDQYQKDVSQVEGPMGSLYAASAGAAQGLLGPVAPWIAKKLGETDSQRQAMDESHGTAKAIGEVGGLTAGLMTGQGVGGLAVKAGEALPAIEGAGYVAKVANSALRQAAEMAIIGGSDEAAKLVQNPNLSAETALSDIGLATALGAGTGAFMTGAVSPLWKATVGDKLSNALKSVAADQTAKMSSAAPDGMLYPIIRKIGSTFMGVSGEDMDAYMAHHKAIQEIPEFQQVYEHALDHVGAISDAVESGKTTLAESKAAYKDLEQSYKTQLMNAGAEADTAAKLAKQALKDGQTKLAADLANQAFGAGDKAAGAVDALRQSVVDGSSKAYDILDNEFKVFSMQGFRSKGEQLAKELAAEGTLEARAQAERLMQYLDQLPANVSGAQAKALIQGLDKVSKYDFNATAFDKGMSRSYKSLRHELDTTLKDAIPAYKKAMEPVAEETQLLSKLNRYGTPETATTRIKSLKNADAYKNEMPLLRDLEQKTGVKFVHEIEPYANPELRAQMMKSMPEYAEAEKTAEALAELKSPKSKQAMQDLLKQSDEMKAILEAQQQLEAAKAAQATLGGTTEHNLQGRLSSVARPGKNIANEAVLSQLPGINGKSLPEIMNLLRLSEVFEKNATRGSKHVNLYGMMMGALGAAAGQAIPGMGLGSMAGAYVDSQGPTLVRKILDKYLSHYGDIAGMSKESAPGATKLMLNKILGSENPISGDAFKAGVDYFSAIKRGDLIMNKAVTRVLEPGAAVIPDMHFPTETDRLKLDKMIAKHQDDPNKVLQMANSELGKQLPDHQAAVATAVAGATNYLRQLQPKEKQNGMLDRPLPPSDAEKARYARAQDIAINPNVVLQHIKDGTLQASDVKDIATMYPSMYENMKQKLMSTIADRVHEQEPIPYNTRIGISIFTGQPLDSSMNPMSIQAAQPMQPQAPPQQGQPKGKPSQLKGKSANMNQTMSQEAEKDRSSRK